MKISKKLIESILLELENNLISRGQSGYGVGHPHQRGGTKRIYGKSEIEYAEDELESEEEEDDIEEKEKELIKISKVFKEKQYE